jgi:UDP-N-acetylmuramoyl-L-alanyl-D-glutamate--2,6-diaminopimelate ligase
MRTERLLAVLESPRLHGRPPEQVSGLAYDSRRVEPGGLFVALAGERADGHDYLEAAAAAGAAAAVVERPSAELGLPQIQVDDSRRALAALAAEWHGHPGRDLTLVGITGTNGKTTVSYLVEAALGSLGPTGLIGTVETRWGATRTASAMTTPLALELSALLARMRDEGVAACAMEVSSHALHQHRADGLLFDAAVFTNLTRDHLDYHRDLASYQAAKLRLFTELLPRARAAGKTAAAVACADDSGGLAAALAAGEMGLPVWTYGFAEEATVRGLEPELSLAGGRVTARWPGGEARLSTRLVGRYNLQNLLAAFAVSLALGLEAEGASAALAACPGVPGRLERVAAPGQGPAVFVDYAHTDDALTQALAALRPLTAGRLVCVFGAGGDRDPGKRPLMGRAVGRAADLAVLTSDNPRTERPEAIMDMIRPGLEEAGLRPAADPAASGSYLSEPDRARAIALAVAAAGPADVVLIAGKGHEDYQIVGQTRRHFDDREQAAAALAAGKEAGRASA